MCVCRCCSSSATAATAGNPKTPAGHRRRPPVISGFIESPIKAGNLPAMAPVALYRATNGDGNPEWKP
ncbi:hypothetical protein KCP73_18475 [Salmonella enterica subsp. enterica]|nr:hypothetical protein KCP73_18475 [Salmonella enterica subsp. enterica]